MRVLLLWLLFFVPGTLVSQQFHVYIQGDNQQAFYVKRSGDATASSSSGFLILPKLQSGNHQLIVGFPSRQWPEQEFGVNLKSDNRGFTLKKGEGQSWQLMDMHSGEVIRGKKLEEASKPEPEPEFSKSGDPFAVTLASAVGDEGIRDTRLIAMASRPSPVATSKLPSLQQKQPVDIAGTDRPSTQTSGGQPVSETEQEKKLPDDGVRVKVNPPVTVSSTPEKSTEQGAKTEAKALPPPAEKEALDPAGKPTDIPANQPKTGAAENKPAESTANKTPELITTKPVDNPATKASGTAMNNKAAENPPAVKTSEKPKQNIYPLNNRISKISEVRGWTSTELIYVDMQGGVADTIVIIIDDQLPLERKDSVVTEITLEETSSSITSFKPGTRANCRGLASERDMLNVRRRAARMSRDQDMLSLLVRDVREKCYTVERLQSLAYVFVTDEMRFEFLRQAYPHAYDPANYYRLESLLNSEDYISRFRGLIKGK